MYFVEKNMSIPGPSDTIRLKDSCSNTRKKKKLPWTGIFVQ